MRSASIVLALAMVMAATLSFLPTETRAAGPPKLSLTVEAGQGSKLIFTPSTIILPSVPIIVNITLINNSSTDMGHTFSIRDNTGTFRVDISVPHPGDIATIEFAVNASNRIYAGGKLYQTETSSDGGVKFVCKPHESLLMTGSLVVGGRTPPPSPELGIFLRAYWIGIIGLAAMLVWVGITYFIIKASSRHSQDHREHIRRGLT